MSAAITCAVSGTGVHAVMGIGGAPEGVLTAAALRCLGGEIQARFRFRNDEERARARRMGNDDDESRVYRTEELASGDNLVFAATGVTGGDLLQGVRFFGGGARTHSLVMAYQSKQVRFVDTVAHVRPNPAAGGQALGVLGPPAADCIVPASERPDGGRSLDQHAPSPGGLHPLAPARWDEPWRQVGQRREHEQPLVGRRVRDLEEALGAGGIGGGVKRSAGRWAFDRQPRPTEQEQVEVELARAPPGADLAPERSLDRLQRHEQRELPRSPDPDRWGRRG